MMDKDWGVSRAVSPRRVALLTGAVVVYEPVPSVVASRLVLTVTSLSTGVAPVATCVGVLDEVGVVIGEGSAVFCACAKLTTAVNAAASDK
ncbi:MAG: hypothetical protein ACTS6O_12730 [Giesbergeria sp.]